MKNFMIILMLLLLNSLSYGYNVRLLHETTSVPKTDADQTEQNFLLNISDDEADLYSDSQSGEDEEDDYKDKELEDLVLNWLLSINNGKDGGQLSSPSVDRFKRSLHYYMQRPPTYTLPHHDFGQIYFPTIFHPQTQKKKIHNTVSHSPNFGDIKKDMYAKINKLMNPIMSIAHASITNAKKMINRHKTRYMNNKGNFEQINIVPTQGPDVTDKPEDGKSETPNPTTSEIDFEVNNSNKNESKDLNDTITTQKPLTIEDINNDLLKVIPYLVKEEVSKQLETIFENRNKDTKNMSSNTMDDKKNNITQKPDAIDKIRDKNKSKFDQQNKIEAKSLFGNFIGNKRFANIFVFYPSKDGEILILKPSHNVSDDKGSTTEGNEIGVIVNENYSVDMSKEKDVATTEASSINDIILETTQIPKTTTIENTIISEENTATTTESIDSETGVTDKDEITTTEIFDSTEDVSPEKDQVTTIVNIGLGEDITSQIDEVITTEAVDSEKNVVTEINEVTNTTIFESKEDASPENNEMTTPTYVNLEDVTPEINEVTTKGTIYSKENITTELDDITTTDTTELEADVTQDINVVLPTEIVDTEDVTREEVEKLTIESGESEENVTVATVVNITVHSTILVPTESFEESTEETSQINIDKNYENSTSTNNSTATFVVVSTESEVAMEESTLEYENTSEMITSHLEVYEDEDDSAISKSKNNKEKGNPLLDLNLSLRF